MQNRPDLSKTGSPLASGYRHAPPTTCRNDSVICEAHFNLVIGTSGFGAEEQVRVCESLGLKVLISADDPATPLPNGTACWGYSLSDEPRTAAFPALAARVASLREQKPGRLGYINLFPNYAGPGQMGANSYEEYLRNFVETVKPDDHNMADTAWPTVVFDSEGEVVKISREDRREHPLLDDSPELPGI